MPTKVPKTIYHLVLQDNGREGAVIADIVSSAPFPRIESGDQITVEQTQPRCWDVNISLLKIEYSPDGRELHIATCLVVDSPCDRDPLEPETGLTKRWYPSP